MLKKKYFLLILFILISCFTFGKPAAALNKCGERSIFLGSPEYVQYRACIEEEINSGKYQTINECKKAFEDPIAYALCTTHVKKSAKKNSSSNSSNSKSNSSNSSNSNSSNSSNSKSNSNNKSSSEEATFTGKCRTGFLGLTSWDCGVEIKDETTLKTGIWQIVANVAIDIAVIAAYLVLGYVIYGGYLYIFSSGDPNKIAGAKKTLTHAFIGLAIVMSAYIIVNSIRIATLGANGKFNCDLLNGGNNCVDPNSLVTSAIQWVIGIAGAVAVIFVVYGGISYTTSAGDPNKLQKAKQIITYALIGLVVVALAEIITAFVSNMIRDANNPTDTSYQTTITKEFHEKHLS